MTKYDAIIIGSGQAGNPLAHKLSAAGWKVAVIEKKWVGGTCVNTGCTPTKTMIASGRVSWLVKRSADYGIHTGERKVDMEEIVKRKNSIVIPSREGITKSLTEDPAIDLIFGAATFTGSKEITIKGNDLSTTTMVADTIFINTGSKSVIPPIPGLEQVNYLTSASILDLLEVPRHLVIVGGSYIALEFGQLFKRLGSEVTILESHSRFLPREDEDIASEMKKILEDDGLHIWTGCKINKVLSEGSDIRLEVEAPSIAPAASPHVLTASHLLVAAGREADTAGLNVKAAGIQLDEKGFITVDDRLQTNIPGIYALGDVKGGPQFTHISYNDHLVVYKNLLENGNESIAGRALVYCMFTDPELGRIGLSEDQARSKGLNIKVLKMPASHIARASEMGEARGLVKAIVDADTKKILGASVLTVGGGELMSILQMAMMGGIRGDTLRDTVFAHPTFAESLNNLFSGI